MNDLIQATYTLPGSVNYFLASAGFGILLVGVAMIIREVRLWK